MKLELILRKYESSRINPSREFRCFVRNDILLGTPFLLLSNRNLQPETGANGQELV
jgi:hypothetical protein